MSKKLQSYVGKIHSHPQFGKVKVLRPIPKSRTLLEVKLIDRGPGYDHNLKRYTGVKVSSGWMRGQNYQYGHIDETHYKHLK